MLLPHFISPLLLLAASVTARECQGENPWGADTLSSIRSTTLTPTATATTNYPDIVYATPTTPLDNRKYPRTLKKSRTVETPTTTLYGQPALTAARTAAPPSIHYADSKKPSVEAPSPVAQSVAPSPMHSPKPKAPRVAQTQTTYPTRKAPTPVAQPVMNMPGKDTQTTPSVMNQHTNSPMRNTGSEPQPTSPPFKTGAPQHPKPLSQNPLKYQILAPHTPRQTLTHTLNAPSSIPPIIFTTPIKDSGPNFPLPSARLPRELCKPCLDAFKRCIQKRQAAGDWMRYVVRENCWREVCFGGGVDVPGRCRAGRRCGGVWECPVPFRGEGV